jgi:hypothetical protein
MIPPTEVGRLSIIQPARKNILAIIIFSVEECVMFPASSSLLNTLHRFFTINLSAVHDFY